MKHQWLLLLLLSLRLSAEERKDLRSEAEQALSKAVRFFTEKVALEGTYLWQYSEDLQKREAEGKVIGRQGWVQPPGTPSVGLAYLKAWEATKDPFYLEAARQTAFGLLRGQLRSGGWAHSIELDRKGRKQHAYRDRAAVSGRNVTTLDDDSTQSAIRFLVRLDAALNFEQPRVRDAVEYVLDSIFRAQYPNGAWPQGYESFPKENDFPVLQANYPAEWSRHWPGSQKYWLYYTLNDRALLTLIETLVEVEKIYTQAKPNPAPTGLQQLGTKCLEAALKAGDFLLLARMPEPQPIWAQQYNVQMQPAWARRFEPPAVTAGESQDVLLVLLMLFAETGKYKYLDPVPRALEFLRSVRLPSGEFARFYELKTSKPLYFTNDYQLTYDDTDLPTHYAFKVPDRTDAIEREYRRLMSRFSKQRNDFIQPTQPRLDEEVRAIIQAQDDQGRWVEPGRLRYHGPSDTTTRVIRTATFIRNIETLSKFLQTTR